MCAARAGAGASWARDGTIVFGGGPGGGLARVSAGGGEPVVLIGAGARVARGQLTAGPTCCPTDAAVIYTARQPGRQPRRRLRLRQRPTSAHARRARRVRPLLADRSSRVRAARAARGGAVRAAATAGSTAALASDPARPGDEPSAALPGPRFAFSRTGSLIYVPGHVRDIDERLHWLDVRAGSNRCRCRPRRSAASTSRPICGSLAMTVETR